jgi:hypothetical protein
MDAQDQTHALCHTEKLEQLDEPRNLLIAECG